MSVAEPVQLIGRRAQLARVEEAVQLAESGFPQVVLVGGEAGVGKTHLVGYVANRLADTGARVLHTTCVELGAHGLPLVPVMTALRQVVETVGPDTLRRAVPGASALLQLLPEYGDRALDQHQQARVPDQFAVVLERFGTEYPAVLVIDDLQWADRSSLDLLGYLARALRPCRVLILGAYRTDDLSERHPLRPALAELGRLPNVRRFELGRFNRAETTELIASVLARWPSAELVDNIYLRSGGNALFALELARSDDPARLPESLRDLILRRMGELPDSARHVLRMAAGGGPAISHALLASASRLPEEVLVTAIKALVDARMLVVDGDLYTFRHALVREAVHHGMLPVERAALHRTYAEALEAQPALTVPERYAAEVAFHWHAAGVATMAFPALLRAADEAQRLSAYAERAQLLEYAMQAWPQVAHNERPSVVDLAESAITAAGWAGDHVRAKQLVDLALAHIDASVEPEQVAMLYAHRAMAMHSLGDEGAPTAIRQSLDLLPASPTKGRARALDLLAVVLLMRDDAATARPLAQEAAAIASAQGNAELEVNSRTTLGWGLAQDGEFHAALAALSDARKTATAQDDRVALARIELNAAQTWHGLGDYAAAIDAAQGSVDMAMRAGLGRGLGSVASVMVTGLLNIVGRWSEADEAAVAALEMDPPGPIAAALHAIRCDIASNLGDHELAREHLSLALAAFGGSELTPWTVTVLWSQAESAVDENRLDDARAIVARALPALRKPGYQWHAWGMLATAAGVERRARVRAAALSMPYDGGLAEQIREIASDLPTKSPTMSAYAAQVAAELGDTETSWVDVAAAWATLGHPYRAAYAEHRAAEVALAAGDPGSARELLNRAAVRARELSARPLLKEARLLARHHGLTLANDESERAEVSDVERLRLTRREIDVLRQVTSGRSNRQIADDLFISTKTVSVHVSNILAKLGVASRGEAAATAYRLRLFESM